MKSVFLALTLLFSFAFANASNEFDSHLRRGGYDEDYGRGPRHGDHRRGRFERRRGHDRGHHEGRRHDDGYGRGQDRWEDYDRGEGYGHGDQRGQYGNPLPFGSYVRSCTSCQVGPHVLTCVCSNSRRQLFTSSVYYNLCRSVGNFEGQLVCE